MSELTGREHADRFLLQCIADRDERIGELLKENEQLRKDIKMVDRNRRKWAGTTSYLK